MATERDQYGAVVPPLYLTTIYEQDSPGIPLGYEYSRVGNPTRELLEAELADKEGGEHALAFSSGSSAATALLLSLSSGDHIVCSQDVYEGTYRLVRHVVDNFGLNVEFVDFHNPVTAANAVRENTKLIWYESVSNPLLKVVNTQEVANLLKGSGAKIVVDNTFASPVCLKPLAEGADVVLQSLTKYINGHHDVTGGALVMNDELMRTKLHFLLFTMGIQLSPVDSFMVSRGLKTLELRMKRHEANAKNVSDFLGTHGMVEDVSYPGFSGMVSFWVKGDLSVTIKMLESLNHVKIAHSLGGYETTVQHPRSMMSFTETPEELDTKGVTNNLIRMSVGLEDSRVINEDLDRALTMTR